MISRRHLLRGLIATPAVVAIGSLMPLKGIKFDPLVRIQNFPFNTVPQGEWWTHRGRLSRINTFEDEMRRQYGKVYWKDADEELIPIDLGYNTRDEEWEPHNDPVPIIQTGSEGSQMGYRPLIERNEYGRKIGFRPYELQPIDTTAVYHIQDDRPQISTKNLKAELARICQWGA